MTDTNRSRAYSQKREESELEKYQKERRKIRKSLEGKIYYAVVSFLLKRLKRVYTLPKVAKREVKCNGERKGSIYIHCGSDSVEDPPVPIPNTEVKLDYAGSTLLATAREIW